MAITGTHSNFAAQAFVAREIRADRLVDKDYTIEEAERLYDASDQPKSIKPRPTRWQGEVVDDCGEG